ncbi:hypothetical protein GCM10011391_03360 [Pullulanibacillus camelliae]|uniref:Uncharacterized protein n=1 Tax=Pullulanibacillus camelliae TaxID=1707096 RepID=A0A8J2YA18_9BACL|nr:hypothetical protein [Pullulanibacillus camelliae]GGE28163.1 hypothetical protein GCM10011391_03360 [Pullulanibacillus camelliae]
MIVVTEQELKQDVIDKINRQLTPKELDFIQWIVENQKAVTTAQNDMTNCE